VDATAYGARGRANRTDRGMGLAQGAHRRRPTQGKLSVLRMKAAILNITYIVCTKQPATRVRGGGTGAAGGNARVGGPCWKRVDLHDGGY
jgi:hypothetical protein